MDYITLMGAEDVARAGHNIAAAAETMSRAASSMDDALQRHRMGMEELLNRFEQILVEHRNAKSG